MKYRYIIALIALVAVSCRKEVVIKLPDYQEKLVVEASIETGQPAIVLLSKSVPYFGTFDFTKPQEAFIKGAFITVTNGTLVDTLKELDPNLGYLYAGIKINGEQGKTYTLKIRYNGKEYSSTTTILSPPKLDSLWFKAEKDNLGFIWQKFNEPAGSGDGYRWFAKRVSRDQFFAAPFNSVFDDKFVDGKKFDFAYDRGPQPNLVQEFRDDPERGYYRKGDTVIVKFCKIGKREYDFWNTYYQNKASNGNPFSAPANVQGTFDNVREVFGSFVGYAPFYDTLIIPKN